MSQYLDDTWHIGFSYFGDIHMTASNFFNIEEQSITAHKCPLPTVTKSFFLFLNEKRENKGTLYADLIKRSSTSHSKEDSHPLNTLSLSALSAGKGRKNRKYKKEKFFSLRLPPFTATLSPFFPPLNVNTPTPP